MRLISTHHQRHNPSSRPNKLSDAAIWHSDQVPLWLNKTISLAAYDQVTPLVMVILVRLCFPLDDLASMSPKKTQGPQWLSGNTLTSYLGVQSSNPDLISSGKAGSCLLLVSTLEYRTLTNCMYRFPLPVKLPSDMT